MNMIPAQIDIEDVVDIATVDQQLETIAVDIELTEQIAFARIGKRLTEARDLHRYKGRGDFEEWVRDRLGYEKTWAYDAIKIAQGIDDEGFPQLRKLAKRAQLEVASAAPDVKEIIAERVAAGEVFTAAQVKEFKQQAATEAVERINSDAEQARSDLEALKTELATKDKATTSETARLRADVESLTKKLSDFEKQAEDYRKSLPKPEKAKEQAAETGGVVLASDGKYHSGSTAEQKRASNAFLAIFSIAADLTDRREPAPVVALGCPADSRGQFIKYCDAAITYLSEVKDNLNGQ